LEEFTTAAGGVVEDRLVEAFAKTPPGGAAAGPRSLWGFPLGWGWRLAAGAPRLVVVAVVPFLDQGPEREVTERVPGRSSGPDASGVQFKGPDEELVVYLRLRREGRPVRLADSPVLHPGDRIQFACSSKQGGYLAVYGFDQKGVTRYLPAASNRGMRVIPGRELALEPAFTLDDTLGEERILGIICAHPFDSTPLFGQLRSLRAPDGLQLDPGCRKLDFRFVKEPE